jgi:hypothetical protein
MWHGCDPLDIMIFRHKMVEFPVRVGGKSTYTPMGPLRRMIRGVMGRLRRQI